MTDKQFKYKGYQIDITDCSNFPTMKGAKNPVTFMIMSRLPDTAEYTWPVEGGEAATVEEAELKAIEVIDTKYR